MFGRNHKCSVGIRDGPPEATQQVNGPVDAVSSYRATMAEDPESDINVEELVSALTKAVTTDGRARRCPTTFHLATSSITDKAFSDLFDLPLEKVRGICFWILREI